MDDASADASLAEIRVLLFQQATLVGQLISGLEIIAISLDKKPSRAESLRQSLVLNAITLILVLGMFGYLVKVGGTARSTVGKTSESVQILTDCTTPDIPATDTTPAEVHKCFDDGNTRTVAVLKQLTDSMIAIAQCTSAGQADDRLSACVKQKLATPAG